MIALRRWTFKRGAKLFRAEGFLNGDNVILPTPPQDAFPSSLPSSILPLSFPYTSLLNPEGQESLEQLLGSFELLGKSLPSASKVTGVADVKSGEKELSVNVEGSSATLKVGIFFY